MFLSNPCCRSIDRCQLLDNKISDLHETLYRYPDMGARLTNHGLLSIQSGELTRNRGCCGTHSRNNFQLQFRNHESAGNPKVEIDSFWLTRRKDDNKDPQENVPERSCWVLGPLESDLALKRHQEILGTRLMTMARAGLGLRG